MKEPVRVSDCVKAMEEKVEGKIPVNVKCRIGVDEFDSYEFFRDFIAQIKDNTNCKQFQVHSRKAFLKGLNPKQNRDIPPLIYERTYQLKSDFPELEIQINGGFKDWDIIEETLSKDKNYGMQGVMIGRLANDDPWSFSDVDRRFYGLPNSRFNRKEVLEIYGMYGDNVISEDPRISWQQINKPILNLFRDEKYSMTYKRFLSDAKKRKDYTSYKTYLMDSIKEIEKMNHDALYKRPPALESEPNINKLTIETNAQDNAKQEDDNNKNNLVEKISQKSVELEKSENFEKTYKNNIDEACQIKE